MQTLKPKLLCIYKVLMVICLLVCLGFSVNAEAKEDLGETVINDTGHSLFVVSIKGEQGDITKDNGTQESMGTLWFEQFKDGIIGLALSHGIEVPTDETGMPIIGRRIHNRLRISKYFDKCTPLLYQALIKGEKLEVVIKFYRLTMTGALEHYFTIELKDAVIVDVTSGTDVRPESCINLYKHTEGVSFVYKTITWTHEFVANSTTDDWKAPL